jgi:tetratricopeptide (TPR) repeat protein
MCIVTSMDLNERGCSLLSQGRVSEGLQVFKKALFMLKKETHSAQMKPLVRGHQSTVAWTGAWFCWLIPTPIPSKGHERFWIFSRPLSMQRATDDSGYVFFSNSDAFTISFNAALASHLQGVEQEFEGDYDLARHSFLVAVKMYNVTLCQANSKKSGVIFSTLSDHLYAVIFSNLAHVYAMLGKTKNSLAFAEQLLKILFYLVCCGRVPTRKMASTHKLLLENAHCLLMSPSNSAAAA